MSQGLLLSTHRSLTLEGARVILEAAKKKAKEIGVDMDIAVVDGGGHLIAFERMDAAKITGIDIAINKAFTSACTRKPTSEYAKIAGPGGEAFGIHASNQGRFMVFGGGVPVFVDGEVIGAVGCSSGSAAQDEAVASAGIEAFLQMLKG
jgi:uncharacterized protein GlcG (DUF336 family)